MAITRVVNINNGEYAIQDDGSLCPVETHYGLSTDPKPTDCVSNADRFMEMDSGKVSLYDSENKKWWPINKGG